ncbi:MAG TPA: hypothetical protein VKR06_17885 [Ktedonosporobacter sp.]|nr:hypothetical protein [Ktedonosporobacter sp.]
MADTTIAAAPVPVSVPAAPRPAWTIWHTLSIIVLLVATGLVGWFIPSRLIAWLVSMTLLIAFIAIAAHGVTGTWRGALIDERNRISLSRFQMLLWTVLILSALLIAVLTNLRANSLVQTGLFTANSTGAAGLIGLTIPSTLWVLMGIATTSLVGAPLVLSTKTKDPNPDEMQATLNQLAKQKMDVSPDNVIITGQVLSYATPNNARWGDLFTGEETGNAANFDLGKIQMFYFTFILILIYGMALGALFASQVPTITAFPDMDTGMLALLGISHAGYLTNKAVPHSSAP